MKKFSVLLLIFTLLFAVSCGTTKVSLGTEVVYEETPVTSEASVTVEEAQLSENAVVEEPTAVEEPATVDELTVVSTSESDIESSTGSEEPEVTTDESVLADAPVAEVDVTEDVSAVEELASETIDSIETADAEFADADDADAEVLIDTEEPIVIEVYEQESNKEVTLTNEVSTASQTPAVEAEPVPTAFFDKVVYYAKLYGNKVLEFVKNNILISLGFLTIAIGIIMLIVDLIKFIVKSVKANNYDDFADYEIEEPEIDREDLYHPVKSAKKATKDSKASKDESHEASDDMKFQSEDEFLRSLLNDED